MSAADEGIREPGNPPRVESIKVGITGIPEQRVWTMKRYGMRSGAWMLLIAFAAAFAGAAEGAGEPTPAAPKDPFKEVAASTDVAWLERVAGSDEVARNLVPGSHLEHNAKALRTDAYARLGALATPESLAAVQRIEQAARRVVPAPSRVALGVWPHPCWHYGDSEVKPLAQATAPDGTAYALVVSHILGRADLFLITSTTPDDASSWSRPMLVPKHVYAGIRDPALTVRPDGRLVFTFVQEAPPGRSIMEGDPAPRPEAPRKGPQEWVLSLEEITQDADRDGWTDAEEARLGLDPNKADSDGDGVPDGKDVCPDRAFPKDLPDAEREFAAIVQKAFFATFGLSGSRHLLLVPTEVKSVELWGYAGPVLYGVDKAAWRKDHGLGVPWVHWEVADRSDAEATVWVSDYEAPLAAGSLKVYLRKIGGEWFVVRREFGPVS